MQMKIGADDLDTRDLTLIRSTAKLRPEPWIWVDAFLAADLWFVDLTRAQPHTPADRLDDARVACLDLTPAHAAEGLRILVKPLKAAHLMRLFDSIVPASPVVAANAAPQEMPTAPVAGEDAGRDVVPWAGKHVRLLKLPNLAKYPVSVELLGWVEVMRQQPVDVDSLHRSMPLDRDMLRDLLNAAARGGFLVDASGAPIAPMAAGKSRFKLW